MEVELPDGATAIIIARDDVTIKTARAIERAKSKTMAASMALDDAGYLPPQNWPRLPSKPEWYEHGMVLETTAPDGSPVTGGDILTIEKYEEAVERREKLAKVNMSAMAAMSDANRDLLDDYETTLVLSMVTSWSYDTEITRDTIVELKADVFEQLAALCQLEYDGTTVDVEENTDPLATTDGLPS